MGGVAGLSAELLDRIDAALAAGHVQPPALDYASYTTVPAERLHEELPQLWTDAYHAACGHVPEVLKFSDGANHYLFDSVHERVVCAWGESRASDSERDRGRQAGFIPGFSRHYEGKDRGHFLSHGQGGLMDVNFFPQLTEVNRGWSAAGKLYRALERHAATHPGTFALSRPLYARDNDTWDPERLEYGLLLGGKLTVLVFPNR